MDLRKKSDNISEPVKIIYSGVPAVKTIPDEPAAKTGSSSAAASSISPHSEPGATNSSASVEGVRRQGEVHGIVLYKSDKPVKVQLSSISCIRRTSPQSCAVHTANGARYELRASFSKAAKQFEPLGFTKVNIAYLVRPAMIESISGGTTKEATVKGVPMPVYVTETAYQQLINRFWGSGRSN